MTLESVFVPESFSYPETWRILLKEWISLIHNYSVSDGKQRDIPYWYGERALTGLLSSAAWRIDNGWALEEFSTLRGQEDDKSTGRGDLWIGVSDKTFTVEAKLTWPDGNQETAKKRVEKRLDEAKAQLKDIELSCQQGNPVSVCYVVPWPKIKTKKVAEETLGNVELLKQLVDFFQTNGHATALFIPDGAPIIEEDRVYPGVALIARVESWAKRI